MTDFLSQGAFALFGLPESYRIDLDDLEGRYRRLQRALHPDRHVASGAHERRMAMQMTARLNEAYAALRSPLERARLLLEQRGRRIEENPSRLDPALLLEQIEIREEIEGLRAADDRSGLSAMRRRLDERVRSIDGRLADLLDGTADEAHLDEAVALCYELQFLGRVLDGLEDPTWIPTAGQPPGDGRR